MKIAKLNPKNWDKEGENKEECFYRHKTRKKVLLVYNKVYKNGFFKDTKTNKVFSGIKNIQWL